VGAEPIVVADPLAALHAPHERLLHEVLHAAGDLVQEESLDHVVVALEQCLAAHRVTGAPLLEQLPVAQLHVRMLHPGAVLYHVGGCGSLPTTTSRLSSSSTSSRRRPVRRRCSPASSPPGSADRRPS